MSEVFTTQNFNSVNHCNPGHAAIKAFNFFPKYLLKSALRAGIHKNHAIFAIQINSYHAELYPRLQTTYSHFESCLGFGLAQVHEIESGIAIYVACLTQPISRLLVPWQLKEPEHQQSWYWPTKPWYSISFKRVNRKVQWFCDAIDNSWEWNQAYLCAFILPMFPCRSTYMQCFCQSHFKYNLFETRQWPATPKIKIYKYEVILFCEW